MTGGHDRGEMAKKQVRVGKVCVVYKILLTLVHSQK